MRRRSTSALSTWSSGSVFRRGGSIQANQALQKLNDDAANAVEERNSLEEQASKAAEDVQAEHQAAIAQLEQKMEEEEKKYTAEREDLQDKLQELEAELSVQQQLAVEQAQQCDTVSQEKDALQSTVGELESARDALQEEVQAAREQATEADCCADQDEHRREAHQVDQPADQWRQHERHGVLLFLGVQRRDSDVAFRRIDTRDLRAEAGQGFAKQPAAAANIKHAATGQGLYMGKNTIPFPI